MLSSPDPIGTALSPRPRGSDLRRYGPLTAILTVLALVVAASVVMTGDEDDTVATEGSETATGDYPDGVVTWSMAHEQGLDAEFPATCDAETGHVAIPFLFRAECIADVEDNGGATAPGVTADSIKVVLWLPNDNDPLFAIIRQALGFDDTVEQIRETQEGLVEIFQAYYQTFGRTVEVEFVQASGSSLDPVAARADAVKAANLEPFAVLGGPLLANTWTEEFHARGIVCVFCPGITPAEPSSFGLTPSQRQINEHVVTYVSRKLKGGTADFAGPGLRGEERVFGYLKLGMNEGDEADAADLEDDFAEQGVEIAETVLYPLDLGRIQEHATNAVTRMKEAGVTTVLVNADPITLPAMTREATKQEWFPEWVLAAFPFTDASVFGRTMDQEQWAHAFGLSYLPPAAQPEANPAYTLYEWYHGEPPPADESLLLTYPQIALFFAGLQAAGPELTTATYQQGTFAAPPTPRSVSQPSVDYGTEVWGRDDYGGIDDMVELWWDVEAEGEDETGRMGVGLYRYVDGGRRYYADEWPEELEVFDPDGSVTTITEVPEAERPPDYPPP